MCCAHSINALSDQCHSVKQKELTSSDGLSDDEIMFSCSSNNFKEKSMLYVDFEKSYRTVYDKCQITDNCELLPKNEYYCELFAKNFLICMSTIHLYVDKIDDATRNYDKIFC